MINITKLKQHPKTFTNLIGISPQQFTTLMEHIEPLWKETEKKLRKKTHTKHRVLTIGSGRLPKCTLEERVAMLLLYTRTYASHVFLGMLFGVDDSRICRYFIRLRPVVASVFDIPQKKVLLSEEEILDLIVDATEQHTENRRKSGGSGKSGKKKAYTIKTQIITNKKGRIKHISMSVPGNMHDKKLYDQTGVSAGMGDLGYLGTTMILPHKSSKLRKLTEIQQLYNKSHSTVRIVVEHVFASLKQFRMFTDRFRGHLKNYNEYFKIVCGLHNLKLS
jgi:hypothetical protein